VFFERGAFSADASIMTSGALIYYSIGLVAIALRSMLNKVFYSLQDTKTPMINGVIGVLLNVILNLMLIGSMQHRGLALATSISTIITTITLLYRLRIKMGPLGIVGMVVSFVKTLLASLVMGFFVYMIYYRIGVFLPQTKLIQLLILLAAIGVGVIVYFLMLMVVMRKELKMLLRTVVRR
jgi:putative peptidoglycan lipid II flippase